MTQTIDPPKTHREGDEEYVPNGGRVPRITGDIRHLVPKLGLREYWYPVCGVNRVHKTKPLKIRMLGEDIALFRGKSKDEVFALNDICPHRGARLSEGDCHYEGTVVCPYHGWVFDGEGTNVAVLSEGPTSIVCGKPGTAARAYPTKTLKGVVWAWMGEGSPSPIEEDVPEEFFNPKAYILWNDRIYWKTNWEVALENSMDAHVQFLHRDNLKSLFGSDGVSVGGPIAGMRPVYTGNGFKSGASFRPAADGGTPTRAPRVNQDYFEWSNGWKWPKHRYRRFWSWLGGPVMNWFNIDAGPTRDQDHWGGGHHLPGMFRFGGVPAFGAKRPGFLKRTFSARSTGGLVGMYTRQVVAVDDWLTRVWYHHYMLPKNRLHKAWIWFNYFTIGRWLSEYNFSQQDSVMLHLSYDTPEKLSGTDAEVVQWRKLVVTRHFGGRNYPFDYDNPEVVELQKQSPGMQAVPAGNGHGNGGSGAG